MRFPQPLTAGRFLKREKRFLVHVELDDGRQVIAHTNNTGSMRGCLEEGGRVWLSPATNPQRKLAWTLEIVETTAARAPGRRRGRIKVGVNTALANQLVREAITGGVIAELGGYRNIRAEVSLATGNSRLDFQLVGTGGTGDAGVASDEACAWVEVKNVSLVEDGCALFPDAPTARGRKHLAALATAVAAGDRGVLVFCIQRGDAETLAPADLIDPEYGRLLREVAAAGVEVLPYRAEVGLRGIRLRQPVPLVL